MNPAGLSPTAIPSVLGRYLLFGKLVYEGKLGCLLPTLNLKHHAKKQMNDLSSPPHFWIFRKIGNHCYSVLHTSPCTSHHAFLSLASAPLPFMTISLVPFELCKYHPSHPLLLFTSLLALLLFLGSLQYSQDTGFTSAMGQQCWAVVYTDNDPQAFTIMWLQPKYIK